ncbi:MAG TPA: redoxin domain-containing protein [Anaerolineaceae bacterium]|nr:redoxin domain-containing protein [Anaerolineaceae bacterium]
MANDRKAQLHPGQMMPDFELRSSTGQSLRLSDFRNRNNLVLIFPEAAQRDHLPDYLAELEDKQSDFKDESTRVLLILPPGDQPFANEMVYSDPVGSAYPAVSAADYLLKPGSVAIVVDRFGEIDAIFRQEPGEALPPGDVLLEEVRFIELQCPE